MRNKSSLVVRTAVYTGLFIALTTVLTAFLHIPVGNGYIHLGDSMIYLSSVLLPFPCGIIVGGLGGALSDIISGYAVYAIPTLIIKSLNAGCFYLLYVNREKPVSVRSVVALILSSIVTVIGYYFVAVYLYGGFKAQLISIPGNVLQATGSAVLYIIVATAIRNTGITAKLKK